MGGASYVTLPRSTALRPLFTDRQENTVANISKARLEHSIRRQCAVDPCYPDLYGFRPLGCGAAHTFRSSDDGEDDNPLDAPFLQGLNSGDTRTTRSYDGIEDDR